jgi:hypothetical protein
LTKEREQQVNSDCGRSYSVRFTMGKNLYFALSLFLVSFLLLSSVTEGRSVSDKKALKKVTSLALISFL